ncbi:MAG: hypothetical protein ACI8Y7_000852, partial [Candidatus Woesearchaeota archaeon]
ALFTALATTGGNGTGAVTFTVTDAGSSGCSVLGTNLSYSSAGTCTVTATKAADSNYSEASSAAQTFTVNNLTAQDTLVTTAQTITFPALFTTLLTTGGNGTGAVTFTVTDTGTAGCSVLGTNLSYSNAGTCTVNATKAADGNYSVASSVAQTFTVNLGTQDTLVTTAQTVTFPALFTTLATTGGNGTGVVTFVVTDTGSSGCSVLGTNLSYSNAGTCTVNATKAADYNYSEASSAAQTFTVNLGTQDTLVTTAQTVTFPALFTTLLTTGGNGTGAVTFTVTDAGSSGCSVLGTNLSYSNAGTCTVTATKAADGNYSVASSAAQTFTVSNLTAQDTLVTTAQTVTSPALFTALATTGGNGTGAVTFTVSDVGSSGCSVLGTNLSYSSAGTCTLTATKAADANYSEASSAAQTFTVNLGTQDTLVTTAQTITFPALFADLATTGGNGTGAVTFTVTDAGTAGCSVLGTNLSYSNAGTCTVNATKAADANYTEASSVAQTFTVNNLTAQDTLVTTAQTVTFPVLFVALLTTGGSGSGAVSFNVTDAGTAGCSVVGDILSYSNVGTCTVTATKAADSNYTEASSVAQTFTVNPFSGGGLSLNIFSAVGSFYSPGDEVSVFATTTNSGGVLVSSTVNVSIYYPNSTSLISGLATEQTTGVSKYNFTLPSSAPIGTYQVNLDAIYGSDEAHDIKTFMISSILEDISNNTNYIFASIENQTQVALTDFGEVAAGQEYRAKIYIYDFQGNPKVPSLTPTITIYDPLRNVIVSDVAMSLVSTGVYGYNFTTSSSQTDGAYESVVSVTASSTIYISDYWELESSPAEVKINSITDKTIPTITADSIITNEGSGAQEYQYEYCVVAEESNSCGGGDDLDYASGAKLLQPGESWNTQLTLDEVNQIGVLWFKLSVYYGTEKSGASQSFTATAAESSVPGSDNGGSVGGGGGGITGTATEIICNSPYMIYEGVCCLDANNNSICDVDVGLPAELPEEKPEEKPEGKPETPEETLDEEQTEKEKAPITMHSHLLDILIFLIVLAVLVGVVYLIKNNKLTKEEKTEETKIAKKELNIKSLLTKQNIMIIILGLIVLGLIVFNLSGILIQELLAKIINAMGLSSFVFKEVYVTWIILTAILVIVIFKELKREEEFKMEEQHTQHKTEHPHQKTVSSPAEEEDDEVNITVEDMTEGNFMELGAVVELLKQKGIITQEELDKKNKELYSDDEDDESEE